jgi:glyoxylase-like metal-dependent hydrolase (beta-lactamase superfamily II)
MQSRRVFLQCVAALIAALSPATASPAQPDAIKAAAEELGVDSIHTLQITGFGATFSVGQNFSPGAPWPRVTLESFKAAIDYDRTAMLQELVREMGARMPRGGGVPFTGERRQIQMLSGKYAWDVPEPAEPSAGALPASCCTPPEAGGTAPVPTPAPGSRDACMLTLWATPQGFVKAAIANNATTTKAGDGTEVSFTLEGKYKMTGFINARHQVERVRTWIDQSIIGDMLVETEYSGYKDFGAVRFPAHILQKQAGFPALDLNVTSVAANLPVDIAVPDNVRNAPPSAPVSVKTQKLAEGVFWITGGTHHSLAIEMNDHIVLVDTPNGEARALPVIEKAKEVIPGKPIRYVVAMHHHWDHLGGIRTAIDEGATIVTHESNKDFLERAVRAPHTIHPDRLSKSGKALKLRTIGAEGTLTDGARTIKLYAMTHFDHTDNMLLVYLPQEKILAEADAYTPPETPSTPLIAPKVPYAAALYKNVQRLKLEVRIIAPFHGARTADMAEVARQAGRVP